MSYLYTPRVAIAKARTKDGYGIKFWNGPWESNWVHHDTLADTVEHAKNWLASQAMRVVRETADDEIPF